MSETDATNEAVSEALAESVNEREAQNRSFIGRFVLSEGAGRFYTALFSALTLIGLTVGGLIAIVEYLEKKSNDETTVALQQRNSGIEARKPFLEKQLDYCLAISTKAAALANADATKKGAALDEFEQLADGPLTIVEDENIAKKIAEFEDCAKNAGCSMDLAALSVNLGHSCRILLSNAFTLNLAALPDRDTGKTAQSSTQEANRIVTFSVSGSFQQGYSLSPTSTVKIDLETGLAVSANIQITNTGELFTGAPVYNTDRMWQWQNQGSLGGSLDFQDLIRTYKHYSGGAPLTNSAYWTPSLGHIVTSSDTSFKRQ